MLLFNSYKSGGFVWAAVVRLLLRPPGGAATHLSLRKNLGLTTNPPQDSVFFTPTHTTSVCVCPPTVCIQAHIVQTVIHMQAHTCSQTCFIT